MRNEAQQGIEAADAGSATAPGDFAAPQRELREPGQIRVIGEHPIQDRCPGVRDTEYEQGRLLRWRD